MAGSDPAALKMLVAGEIQFFTLMGGVLGAVVPVADDPAGAVRVQDRRRTRTRSWTAPLGAYIREEMAAKGIHGFPVGAFDNGMRQITPVRKPVVVPADLAGHADARPRRRRCSRTCSGRSAAEPVIINSIDIYAALKDGKADAQENPLALVDSFKLYEVVKYVSMTNHMWSGFNQMAHLATWQRLPGRHPDRSSNATSPAPSGCSAQDQEAANGRLRAELDQARPDLQRRRSGAVPARALGLLRQVEGTAGKQVLGAAGAGDGNETHVSCKLQSANAK